MILDDQQARLFIKNQCAAFGSLREAATHFNIDVGYLSRIINNKRPLYAHIAKKFGLSSRRIFEVE